jgi:hypothetical protein
MLWRNIAESMHMIDCFVSFHPFFMANPSICVTLRLWVQYPFHISWFSISATTQNECVTQGDTDRYPHSRWSFERASIFILRTVRWHRCLVSDCLFPHVAQIFFRFLSIRKGIDLELKLSHLYLAPSWTTLQIGFSLRTSLSILEVTMPMAS